MNLGQRIKDFRAGKGLNQEELAERLYVSRQTISSWENDKSYPDIHSLLMMSDLFGVSLDTLIKGDIEIMKEKVDQSVVDGFKKDNWIFAGLVLLCIVSAVPLMKQLKAIGTMIWGIIVSAALFYALKVEKAKKDNDVHTYKEIVSFYNGEKLDSIEKAREEGKRNYQRVIFLLIGALAGVIIAFVIHQFM
ncbi:MAG: helix-turn-helix transcriptional regulator [Erysipelotrichaceae bacterium]|nr:helix-turn-helix transcriptional regulator [Erysipelotrichaceae bacterium]